MIGCVVDIVGIAIGNRGRSCEEHVAFCSVVLAPDVLLCLVKEEIVVEGRIKTVVSAFSAAVWDFCLALWWQSMPIK
jgi:hypothetical protein